MMTSPVLFSTGASPASTAGTRNLVEFKAGKMEMREKMVHPIKKQGLVYLRQSMDDNLMHFCWRDRQSGVVEDDLILFPDDCEFKRVKECTTGRVFVLKMKSSGRKMFFWMQESRTDKDEEYCKKINEMLNNPPRAGSDMGSPPEVHHRDLQAIFGNMTQEQVAQLLSSNGVNLASLLNSAAGRSPSSNSGASASSTASTTNSGPTSATSVSSNSNNPATALGGRDSAANLNDFRALLSGALMEGNEDEANALMAATMDEQAEGGAAAASSSRNTQQPFIDLSTAMNSESLAHLLNDQDFLKQIEPHLPPISQAINSDSATSSSSTPVLTDEDRKNQLRETISSSQFRSSLSQFCIALQSGQLGPLMSQFGLNQACVDAANLGNLEAFVRALDDQTRSTNASNQPQSDQRDKN